MPDVLFLDGHPVPVGPEQTVAGALYAAGIRSWRTTRFAGRPRGIFCGIGACYDCLVTIDGAANQRACLAPARPGTVVTTDPTEPAATTVTARATAPARASYDVAVVGAGPAGLAAAAAAALGGGRIALLDSGSRPGGQYWRHRARATGPDWAVYTGLESIVEERVDYRPGTTVWLLEKDTRLRLHTHDGVVDARRVVLATGAYDRALPFPGWDLPGVVTPGAAQALLKGSGVLVGRRVVVAGAGPFLFPVAVGLADAGARVVAVVEAGDPRAYLRHPRAVLAARAKLREAAGYGAALARRRIPYLTRSTVVAAHGDGRVSTVVVAGPGGARRLDCDALAVGYGFTANLELALGVGAGSRVAADGGLALRTRGEGGETTVDGLYAAGEVTGVGGAALAVVEGELAGAAATRSLGFPSALSDRERHTLIRRRDRLREFADAMHAVHAPPPAWWERLEQDTLVCRCEEVTAGAITAAVTELGATDARTVRSLARPGMGWCQGRVCGYATAELTAYLCGRPSDQATFAGRPFAAPVQLGWLSESLALGEEGDDGVHIG